MATKDALLYYSELWIIYEKNVPIGIRVAFIGNEDF